MQSEPTPGPWMISPEPEDDETIEITSESRIEGSYVPIATLETGYVGIIGDEQEANARLIAAAPDLLAAAKAALAEMCSAVAPRNSFTDAADALDAAISKATGSASND